MLDVAVIIVSWNVRDYLADCIRSVNAELDYSRVNGEVWVVDNASTDGTLDLLETVFPSTRVIVNEKNQGYGAANNRGMGVVHSANTENPRYFLLLNPDTLVRPGAIGHMVRYLDSRPEAGMAAPRLVYGDGRFQHNAFAFPGLVQLVFDLFPLPDRLYDSRLNGRYPRRSFHPENDPFEIDYPLGAAMLVRSDVAEATGGFDHGAFHMYCEEIDWCWRIRKAGWHIYSVPRAEMVHFGGESTRQVKSRSVVQLWQSRSRLYRRYQGRLKYRLARKIAIKGLARLAKKADTPELRQAYLAALEAWRG